MLIVGIDPGLLNIGWSIVESTKDIKFVDCGTIKVPIHLNLQDKLLYIHEQLLLHITPYKPSIGAIEQTVVNINPKASLALCHAKGSAMLSLALCGIKLTEYSPTAIKKALTGKGNADKEQVAKMLSYMFTDAKITSSHAADALATAVTHALHCSFAQ